MGMLGYTLFGGCPHSWTGFSAEAFVDLWEFFKLSLASGVMLAVRIANELGAGNAKGAKFGTVVSVVNTLLVGFIFLLIVLGFNEKLALIFTSSSSAIQMVNELAILLAFTILLNCIQPVLSGVADGSGRQAAVSYINIGSYYMVGMPLGVLLGWLLPSGIIVSVPIQQQFEHTGFVSLVTEPSNHVVPLSILIKEAAAASNQ